MAAKEIEPSEIATKNTEDACWITIDGKVRQLSRRMCDRLSQVYNVTRFAPMHPGGAAILQAYGAPMAWDVLKLDSGGKDATEAFWSYHRHEVLEKYHDKYFIGTGDSHSLTACAPE